MFWLRLKAVAAITPRARHGLATKHLVVPALQSVAALFTNTTTYASNVIPADKFYSKKSYGGLTRNINFQARGNSSSSTTPGDHHLETRLAKLEADNKRLEEDVNELTMDVTLLKLRMNLEGIGPQGGFGTTQSASGADCSTMDTETASSSGVNESTEDSTWSTSYTSYSGTSTSSVHHDEISSGSSMGSSSWGTSGSVSD